MKLTEHQQIKFDSILSEIDNCKRTFQPYIGSLTGFAGTGKTFMTAYLIKYFSKMYSIDVCTPTHKSLRVIKNTIYSITPDVKNVSFRTIHSYCGLKLKQDGPKLIIDIDGYLKIKQNFGQVLIIDESSMVSEQLFNFILSHIKKHKIKIVLFVGDNFQLLPVEEDKSKKFPVYDLPRQYNLEEIIRQKGDNTIIDVIDSVRKEIIEKTFKLDFVKKVSESKNLTIFDTEKDMIKHFCQNDNEDKIFLNYTNDKVNYINAICKRFEDMKSKRAESEYSVGDHLILQGSYNDVKNGSEIKILEVQETKFEDLECFYMKVIDIYEETTSYIRVLKKSSMIEYKNRLSVFAQSKMWSLYWGLMENFTEVKHAWSCTVHKAQGSTFNEVYINFKDFNVYSDKENLCRLLYVAFSRTSNKVYLLR